jgi:alkylhydroperoxidase/carboxymuconolactone decarboxylase family protein YurZ
VTKQQIPEAWIDLVSEEDVRAGLAPDTKHPYDFGFLPGMSRLIRTHKRIGQAFGQLYGHVMFVPGHLSRPEREMIAAVAAAAQDCHY